MCIRGICIILIHAERKPMLPLIANTLIIRSYANTHTHIHMHIGIIALPFLMGGQVIYTNLGGLFGIRYNLRRKTVFCRSKMIGSSIDYSWDYKLFSHLCVFLTLAKPLHHKHWMELMLFSHFAGYLIFGGLLMVWHSVCGWWWFIHFDGDSNQTQMDLFWFWFDAPCIASLFGCMVFWGFMTYHMRICYTHTNNNKKTDRRTANEWAVWHSNVSLMFNINWFDV